MFLDMGLPAGLKIAGTVRESRGRWYQASLMRWFEGMMRAIGGWAQRTTIAMTGKPRALHDWRDNTNTRWLAIGTEQKLYALSATSTTPSDITPAGFTTGRADAAAAGGYGSGVYGAGTYGTPRVDMTATQDASMWTLDNFGQYLYGVMSDDGKIYKWQLNTGTPAAALGGTAPITNDALVTTPEGFLFILGAAGVKRRVQWPDQQSDSTWTPAATNQAGSYDLQTQSRLMCGKRLRASTLLWTEQDAHLASYVGLPFVYRFDPVGASCGIISRGAFAGSDTRVMWMSQQGFFIYDGVVRPVECEIFNGIFLDLNYVQRSKITASADSAYNEFSFYYPSAASTENDRVVRYNVQENTWTIDYYARLASIDRGVFSNPIRSTSDGYLFDHETGVTYTGATYTTPFALSGLDGDGDELLKCREIMPDEATAGQATVTVLVRDTLTGTPVTYGPFTPAAFTQARFCGRFVQWKVQFTSPSGATWGNPQADIFKTGRRR